MPAGPRPAPQPRPSTSGELPPAGAAAGPLAASAGRLRGASSELRRQLREQKRVRAMALSMVVALVLGAPMLYFGVLFATRDPALTALDRLQVPAWAAQSPEDRIISGSRWCFIDCRFRERRLESLREPGETATIYRSALRDAGWTRWEVEGCPQVAVDGDYSCWTRDEYTLDLWVHPPDCAYDPLLLRPDPESPDEEDSGQDSAGGSASPGGGESEECTGAVVEIKMQNRVADERGLPGPGGGGPGAETPGPTGSPTSTPSPTPT